jgi:hypothetical protein
VQVLQTVEQAKFLQQPYYDNNHNYHVKNGFDSALHGNVSVHEPEKNSDNNKDNNDGK